MLLKPRNGLDGFHMMSFRTMALTLNGRCRLTTSQWGLVLEAKLPAFHIVPRRSPSMASCGLWKKSMNTSAVAMPLVGAMLTVAGAGVTWQAAALTLLSSFVSTTLWLLSAHTWIGASRNGSAPISGMETSAVALTASVSPICPSPSSRSTPAS